jgi:hypothetical protein
MRRAAWALVAGFSMVVGLGAAACSGGAGEVAPVSLEPIASTLPSAATTPSTTVAVTSVSTTDASQPDTTQPDTTFPELTGPVFSDELGVKVASAPGVNTPGDTRQLLPEGLYVHIAWTADPADPSVFTVQPDDIPILEAYANASRVYYLAALTTLTVDPEAFAPFVVDSGAKYESDFADARSKGFRASLGSGVLLRPYVLGDRRTTESAVILDCYLEDEKYLEPGEAASLGELETKGTLATMVLVDGRWKVDVITTERNACV